MNAEQINLKIKEIEDEMARTQKNKATNAHMGLLKAKIAKLKRQLVVSNASTLPPMITSKRSFLHPLIFIGCSAPELFVFCFLAEALGPTSETHLPIFFLFFFFPFFA